MHGLRRCALAGCLVLAAVGGLWCPWATAAETGARWISSWAAAPSDQAALLAVPAPMTIADESFRTTVHLSAGGSDLRLRLSNELGDQALAVDHVTVARWRNGRVVPGSIEPILFQGAAGTSIAAGTAAVSDGLAFPVQALSDLVISIHVPGPVPRLTAHVFGQNPTWMSGSDETSKEMLRTAVPTSVRYIVRGVDVLAGSSSADTIVAMGDSITDGEQSSFDRNHRWPDFLAQLLQRTARQQTGIVNVGISGNRLLRPGWGAAALTRLDRDVFALPNVSMLLLLEGINDIGLPIYEGSPMPSAEELKSAYTQVVARAHEHGIKVVGATLMPYKASGGDYYSAAGDQLRRDINDWMRTAHVFDQLVDLDRITADPADAAALSHTLDSGDGVHPADSGYAVIAQAFAAVIGR